LIRVEHGDCLEVIPRLVAEGVTVDAIVTDPPYGLEFMGKEWDAPWKYGMRPYGMTDTKGRAAGPSFVSSRNPVCQLCHKHKRGAKGCRCPAPEFDETTKRLGDLRTFQSWSEAWALAAFDILRPGGFLLAFGGTRTHHRMTCAIEDAGFVIQDTVAWLYGTGFPKHKSHLKPAFEPICLAYKPGGARTMQVDEARIPANGEDFGDAEAYATRWRRKSDGWLRPHHGNSADLDRTRQAIEKATRLGRWPANVCHDGSDEVLAAFPRAGGGFGSENRKESRGIYGDFSGSTKGNLVGYGDSGSAARFFFSAKAGVDDRWGSRHPTVKPVALIRWLVQLVTPPGGLFLDPFAGSGTAGVAALAAGRNAILIEQDAGYVADIRERLAHYAGDGRHSLSAKNRNRRETIGTLL
jgi:site-specific DNA-methyltransferase (adenine-specific)